MFDKQTVLSVKKKYLDFISGWPTRFRYKGKNFKELFVWDNGLSLWWLSETQKKDPEASPVFENLCRLEKGQSPKMARRGFKDTILGYFLARLGFLFYMSFKILIFKLCSKRDKASWKNGDFLLFCTLYGVILKDKEGRLKDRNFLNLPEEIENELKIRTRYVSFYSGSILKLLGDVKRLRTDRVIFCEQFLGFWDLLRAFDFPAIFRYVSIEKKKNFRDSFWFDGGNVFSLFQNELRGSFLGRGIFEWVLASLAFRKILKKYKSRAIISFLEMYPYSRAVYYAVKKDFKEIPTIAYQHASITPMKLWYAYSPQEISLDGDYINRMPIPDYFFFNGSMGREILAESGYPENRCFLVGSLRLDEAVKENNNRINIHLPQGKKRVIIATTYTPKDARKIIDIVFEAFKDREEYFLIFKAHANYPVDSLLGKYNFKNYIISEDNIYSLIRNADVLITSYSTTAEEAIALGCPVVEIDTGMLIDMSALFAIGAARIVRDAGQLNSALDILFSRGDGIAAQKASWPSLIEKSFYKLDGKSKERFINFTRQVL